MDRSRQNAEVPPPPIGDPGTGDASALEYAALQAKVDAFAGTVASRRGDDLHCRAGCAACCHVELAVSSIEAAAIRGYLAALAPAAKRRLRDTLRGQLEKPAGDRTGEPPQVRCVMLRPDDTCAIYAARPLVCRSQGLPLIYPQELVPEAARRGLTTDGRALACCPLNFTSASRPPLLADLLDAERVDVLLALVNRRHEAATAAEPLLRYALTDLAREFVE